MFSRGDFWTYLWNYVIHTKPCNSATVLPFQEQRQFFTTVLCSVKKMYNLAPFNSTILGDKMTLKILMKSIEIFKKVEFESTCKEISHRGTCGISLWRFFVKNHLKKFKAFCTVQMDSIESNIGILFRKSSMKFF